jgi:ATP-dependent helicase/nuclease subunit A
MLLDKKTEAGKPEYTAKDIAILLRTRKHQYLFEKHLRLLNIPYTNEEINDLFYAGPVNDIISVLHLCAYPLDSASYAEMLRSPFAGLSLTGVALCMSIFKNADKPEVFNDEPLSLLDDIDKAKYLNGKKIYLSICDKAAEKNVSSLISELWYNEGYRYETEWNPVTSVYKEFYDYLFHLAVKADTENLGLSAFTDLMLEARNSGGHFPDNTIPLERPDAVNIMTIHKSKGLEFPVVFLPCCGNKSQSDRGGDVYFSNETGIAFNPPLPSKCCLIPDIKSNFFWQQASAEVKQKRLAELRRLLYVGMTRAEKELYITGSLNIKEKSDNFSLTIKNLIEKKCIEKWKREKNLIEDDTILNDNTFFGLILTSIISHIPHDGLKPGSSFFNLEEIPVYTGGYIENQETVSSEYSNDRAGLNQYINKVQDYYQKAEKIQTPVLTDNHISPVSLRKNKEDHAEIISINGKTLIDDSFSGKSGNELFINVDTILERFSKTVDITEKFNPASFGTIAHICVDARLNKKEPLIPANLTGSLKPAEYETLLKAGKELAERFINSPLGKIASNTHLRESEFAFRSIIKNKSGNEMFINGSIDLFFEDENSIIHILDFKTDNKEEPLEHIPQMACYYHAVNSLFSLSYKKECRVWLYYLRSGHAVELTEEVKTFDLEKEVFSS